MIRNLLLLMLIFAATPVVACADEPAGEPTTATGPATTAASNQAAALDISDVPTDSPTPAGMPNVGQQVVQPSPDREAAAGSPADQTAPAAGQAPQPGTQPEPQTKQALQPGPSQPLAALRSRQPVPWYRNGLLSLVVVLAVIAAVVYLVRRLVPSVRMLNGGAIEILGRNHLTPKQSLALVRVGQRVLLVGISAERLSTLCEIKRPEEVAELLVYAPGRRSTSGREPTGRFEGLLGEVAGEFEEPDRSLDETVPGRSEPLDRAKGRLQGLLSRLRTLQEQ